MDTKKFEILPLEGTVDPESEKVIDKNNLIDGAPYTMAGEITTEKVTDTQKEHLKKHYLTEAAAKASEDFRALIPQLQGTDWVRQMMWLRDNTFAECPHCKTFYKYALRLSGNEKGLAICRKPNCGQAYSIFTAKLVTRDGRVFDPKVYFAMGSLERL